MYLCATCMVVPVQPFSLCFHLFCVFTKDFFQIKDGLTFHDRSHFSLKLLSEIIEIKFIMIQRCVHWRPKSCCGLFSLEKGSVIIAIIAIIMAISASFGHGHVSFLFRFENYYITYFLVFGDIILSVLFNFMLIYGISKERSAYFPPWIIFYVLNITVVSELSSKTTHLTTT